MLEVSNPKWPFIPNCLNEILSKDMLAVIEAGSYDRLGRPLTILDFDPKVGSFSRRIESTNEKRQYEDFCRYFRNQEHVKGGDMACKKWDDGQAKISVEEFQKTGDPFRLFPCHLGLMDMTYVIQLRDRPMAIIFSGQFCPSRVENISDSLNRIANENNGEIRIEKEEIENLNMLISGIAPMPEDARERLKKEALHIQQIAEAEFLRRKRQNEQDFLDDLRNKINMPKEINLDQMQEKIFLAIRMIKEYCHCEYVIFFAGMHENDTVLTPFAQTGFPENEEKDQLPHFNWTKAKLPLENFILDQQSFSDAFQRSLSTGIRGGNREYCVDAACLVPTTIGDRYRSVLALGPFSEAVSIEAEKPFLIEIARIIGVFARTGFEVLYLEQERRRWENTAKLLTHEYKTALTTITTPIGMARSIIQKSGVRDADRADKYLKQAEDHSLWLGRVTSGTLEGIVTKVEAEDLEIQNYSLLALVENCVSGFMESARTKNLELIIDRSIGVLPYAEVDVPRLTIAMANLIENAIKYSFSKSKIFIRSQLNITSGMDNVSAIIEVDNIGFEIREQDRQRIFEVGERGGDTARIKRIPGSGYGLWEARSIIKAHGGELHVNFHPTDIHKHEGRANRVVFSIEVPLKQKK